MTRLGFLLVLWLSISAFGAGWTLRLCMVAVHIFFVGALFLLDTDLRRETYSHPWYTGLYLFLVLATLVQYWCAAGSNPGYVMDVLREDQEAEADMKRARDSLTRGERPREVGSYYNGSARIDPRRGSTSSSSNRTCPACNVWQPPRSKHCHDCDKCVLRFDHHCVWLGTCVGHQNHCRFWWYIFEETLVCLWTSAMYVTAFSRRKSSSTWLHNAAVVILLAILLCFLIFLVMLLLFHCYLVITNQTTYELIRRGRIPDFRNLPENIKPYSKGYRRNIYTFCCSRRDGYTVEEMPSRDILEARASNSFLENLYFNCC